MTKPLITRSQNGNKHELEKSSAAAYKKLKKQFIELIWNAEDLPDEAKAAWREDLLFAIQVLDEES